jgi:cell division protein FtsW (lipid II flippase)
MDISQPIQRLLGPSLSGRLLRLAALFLGLYALGLTISPTVRNRSFDGFGELRWLHWIGFLAWLLAFLWLQRSLRVALPNHDRMLIPLAGLLSGWGLLTIWRLTTLFGLRQSAWVLICAALFILALRERDRVLDALRRYKYLWLSAGFAITALTFFFGTNPSGFGPDLWLGCCGLYFQPSEPLKLLLIIYLAAYLADRQPLMSKLLPLMAPTALMTSMALVLLLAQRDLGTAWVFIFIYTLLIYAASGQRRVLLASLLMLVLALFAGYELFGLVHARVESWLNPWVDPSGNSYQIVQALLAVANGGMIGAGPGMGNPGFVPVSHSDFIYTSIVEETGVLGAVALLALIAFLAVRALRIGLHARDAYQRYLAIGLAAYIGTQSLLIIGGTIRLLPLTGLPLPLVSYGGSSMLTSFFALYLLAIISHNSSDHPPSPQAGRPILVIAGGLLGAFALAALVTGWWGLVRGPDLLTRTDNARRSFSDRYVPRGALLAVGGEVLNETVGDPGEYRRQYDYPAFSTVLGYSHPNYGQVALENGLDPVLRGEEYQATWTLWINHMLYGQPAPGLDVRLSLDVDLQLAATELLGDQPGAAMVLDNASGHLLTMVSAPGYDANTLDEDWDELLARSDLPLLNRASQGAYPPGTALGPLLLARLRAESGLPALPAELSYTLGDNTLTCARTPSDPDSWNAVVAAGCPGAVAELGLALGSDNLLSFYRDLGLYSLPELRVPGYAQEAPPSITRPGATAIGRSSLLVSPLHMLRAAAALSNAGRIPALQLALSVEDDGELVQALEPLGTAYAVLNTQAVSNTLVDFAGDLAGTWSLVVPAFSEEGHRYTWFIGGTLAANDSQIPSLTVVVLLESYDLAGAQSIGQQLLLAAMRR